MLKNVGTKDSTCKLQYSSEGYYLVVKADGSTGEGTSDTCDEIVIPPYVLVETGSTRTSTKRIIIEIPKQREPQRSTSSTTSPANPSIRESTQSTAKQTPLNSVLPSVSKQTVNTVPHSHHSSSATSPNSSSSSKEVIEKSSAAPTRKFVPSNARNVKPVRKKIDNPPTPGKSAEVTSQVSDSCSDSDDEAAKK